jgi:hypothetical protein
VRFSDDTARRGWIERVARHGNTDAASPPRAAPSTDDTLAHLGRRG